MASVTTSEFIKTSSALDAPPFSLIEQRGLVARLVEELARASSDLMRDPRGFIRDLFSDDTKDAKRRRRIQIGLACAVAAHIAILALIAFLGWRSLVKPTEAASNLKVEIVQFPSKSFDKPDEAQPDMARGDNKAGGGGGGNSNPAPPSKGPLPQMSSAPQIVKPLVPPAMKPALPVSPTVLGPDGPPPPAGIALGIPTGVPGEAPAPGLGEGDGIGGNKGNGAGPGKGPGSGAGGNGGKGVQPGNYGSPDGTIGTSSSIDWRTPPKSGYSPFSWIYKARAAVTPEAQENRVIGTVLLRATFHADGRITDIEVVNAVPYMTQSAIDALSHSKFRPATINGVPVTLTKVLVKQEVHY